MTMQPGTLTKHTLLYEGNFNEWVGCTDTLLRAYGLQGGNESALAMAEYYNDSPDFADAMTTCSGRYSNS